MNRQRKWQDQQQKNGRCRICGSPAVKLPGRKKRSPHCLRHVIYRREYQRKRNGWKRRYKSVSYTAGKQGKTK